MDPTKWHQIGAVWLVLHVFGCLQGLGTPCSPFNPDRLTSSPLRRGDRVFRRFEKLLDPYPPEAPRKPPRGFFAFVWACTEGARPAIVAMTLFTAMIGAFEALLFSMLGHICLLYTSPSPRD